MLKKNNLYHNSQEEKLPQNTKAPPKSSRSPRKQPCCMETTPTHKDKTQHKQSSPKPKCQDKACQ